MKQFYFVLLTIVSLSSTYLMAKPLQPVYFDDPSFDINSPATPEAMRSFYASYIHAMKQIEKGADISDYFIIEGASSSEEAVEPLLGNINFNQYAPYNNMCPIIDGGRALTGCVATAMAQVMRYYKYPAFGTGTFTYTGGKEGAKTVNLENHPFDWNNILESYDSGNYTTAQANAVANLMLMCGASLNMNYDKDGSGAHTENVETLLKNNFGYSSDIRFISTANSTDPETTLTYWAMDVIRPELEAGHPLIFAGFPAIGQTGHCFVIDGYKVIDGEYYYHVNWGWGGAGNSYCLINNLETDGLDFSGYNVQMVYYIYPSGKQGIESIETNTTKSAKKFINNGQLIIERNNSLYSPLGNRIR